MLSPPSAKKSSSALTRSADSTACQIAASSASMPGAGLRNGFALTPAADWADGSGRAARSILPLASSGQTVTSCHRPGTM